MTMSPSDWDDERLRRALDARATGSPPDDLFDRVVGVVRVTGTSTTATAGRVRRWAGAAMAAAVALSLVASVVVLRPPPAPAIGTATSAPAHPTPTGTAAAASSPSQPPPSAASNEPSPSDTARRPLGPTQNAPEEAIHVLNGYAREHQDVFGGLYIDREADPGAIVMLFTRDADVHLVAIEALVPDLLLRTRTVRFTEAELHALQQRIGDEYEWLRSIGFQMYSTGTDVIDNVVELTGGSNEPGVAERIYDRYGSEMLRVEVNPITEEPEQPQGGPGWRLLAEIDRGEPYTVEVATSESELARLWRDLRIDDPPAADLSTQIVIRFSPAISGSCPQVHFAGIVIEDDRLYGDISFPIPEGMACTGDANPYAFVVAVERAVLPESPFGVHLFEESLGQPGEVVRVDLGASPTTLTRDRTATGNL